MTTYITTEFTGQTDIRPRRVKIKTSDSFAIITAAGYLNKFQQQGYSFYPDDFFDVSYGDNLSQTFTTSISSGTYTLEPAAGDVVLPVIANHIAVYSGTAGALTDDAATAINGGNIQAGLSGTAGTLASFPATAAKGSLKVVAVANTGDTATTISNVAMGQASVISIPDPAAATANFAVAPAALVNNNLVKASGVAGLVADAGARIISNTTAAYGGGGTTNQFAATGLTAAAKGTAVIRASANSVSITKALPGTDTLDITFSADPGAGTTVDYIYTTAAMS